MTGRDCDIAIVGGGLSGGLIALALAQARPELSVLLVEAGETLGGNHRWSWFDTDLSPAGETLMAPFRKTEWSGGYEVRFPAYTRELKADYRSLHSPDFAAALARELPQGAIITGAKVTALAPDGVKLGGGDAHDAAPEQQISARKVIDCRGISETGTLQGGWQVFMGRHFRTPEPHHVTQPVIMDATVEQLGGYRFVYVLPLGAHDLFIEDTYYQDTPVLDRSALSARLDEYAKAHGWEGELVDHETGVLPVITGGDFKAYQKAHRAPGVAMAGARGGFVHPLTSYTVPIAVNVALAIAEDADLPADQLAAKLEAMARRHWRSTGFYRMLGKILFGAAAPADRYGVFQRFYRLPEPLIERFYAAKSTLADQARVLTGNPPVPISSAIGALLSSNPSLDDPNRKTM